MKLTKAQKRRRKRIIVIGVSFVFVLVSTLLETLFVGLTSGTTGTSLLFFLLMNLNLLALFWLVFFVIKNLLK